MVKNTRSNLIVVLGISSLFSIFLSFIRIIFFETFLFTFLIWNLFLAWIPFLFSLLLLSVHQNKDSSKITLGIIFSIWLIFFPNAPYIITDLFHLRIIQNVPLWFDTVLIFSYVWNGLILGFLSLLNIHYFLDIFLKKIHTWIIVIFVLLLSGFGIYIGRYLRWNSWDVVSNPILLFKDVFERMINPFAHPRTYSITFIFFLFLVISYSTFRFLLKNNHFEKE